MALDQRKWQKKVERKKKKQREKRRALIQFQSLSIADRIENCSAAPILHCRTSKDLWLNGMSGVLISRKLSSGNIALAVFLLDIYCLGVKDAMCDIVTPGRYDEIVDRQFGERSIENLRPESARKLIEGAIAYAESLGFNPHPDYHKAKAIFGDIDASQCTDEFEYGNDGKPMFIAGPFDSPWRVRRIMETLAEHLGGEKQFDYLLPIRSPEDWNDDFDPTFLIHEDDDES